jgi:hypothetical protein
MSHLNSWQARSVLELLESLHLPARQESYAAAVRARGVALDWWYRAEWLGEVQKAVLDDMCKDWKLGRTEIDRARVAGLPHVHLAYTCLVGQTVKGQRVQLIESLIESMRGRHGGSVRRSVR